MRLAWRPFRWRLPRPMRTAAVTLTCRRGWLLRLETAEGRLGWGEAGWLLAEPEAGAGPPPLPPPPPSLPVRPGALPGPFAFAIGAALAELEDPLDPAIAAAAPPSAWLLPAGEAALPALDAALAAATAGPARCGPVTFKWKVAVCPDARERRVLEALLRRLPAAGRLRLDANGGWDRPTAWSWAGRLRGEPRLEWLEQPLPPEDGSGLEQLARLLPVALDESLQRDPSLGRRWPGWQVRRPAREGDPRPLRRALRQGRPHLILSSDLETGIGRRWLRHLAGLQARGPTPAAPGLAPGWTPEGEALFAEDPAEVWAAAVAGSPR
jgi:O-succinylbenzoate synthase